MSIAPHLFPFTQSAIIWYARKKTNTNSIRILEITMHNTEISNANPSETLDASNFYKEHLLKFTRAYLLSVGISSLEFLDMADNDVESFNFHTDRINEAIAKAELDLAQ